MKKIISLILALVMVMGLAVTASAAGISVTLNAPEGATASTSKITYYAYKVADAEIGADGGVTYSIPASAYQYVTANGNPGRGYFTFTPSADGTKYYIALTEEGKAADPSEVAYALSWGRSEEIKVEIPYNETTGTYYNDNLDDGYYGVYSSLSTNRPNLVQTIGTMLEITEKIEYPTVTKTINGEITATVDNKNTVEFTLTIQIPNAAFNNNTLYVYDETDGVTIDPDSIEVIADNMTYAEPESVTYEDNKLTVEFIQYFYMMNVGKEVTIKYNGTVDALEKDATNKAYIGLGDYYISTESTVTISNAKFSIYKHTGTGENKEPLEGAGFVVAKTDNGNTLYYKMTDGTVSWVSNIADATEVKSNAEGNVVFEGLAAGSYKAIEKTVPAGYNKAQDTPFTIETDDDGIALDPEIVDIVNNTGSELPSTGGIGTTLFYVLGGLMMTGAAVLMITKKRMA